MTRTTTIRTALLALSLAAAATITGCDQPLELEVTADGHLRVDAEELEAFLGDEDDADETVEAEAEGADSNEVDAAAELDLEAADDADATTEPPTLEECLSEYCYLNSPGSEYSGQCLFTEPGQHPLGLSGACVLVPGDHPNPGCEIWAYFGQYCTEIEGPQESGTA
ncbi:MAG: hypothetical protein KC486_07470 [Myxococcales bacterium]|nr:hypothetical protein [Myxococcales bacterium]